MNNNIKQLEENLKKKYDLKKINKNNIILSNIKNNNIQYEIKFSKDFPFSSPEINGLKVENWYPRYLIEVFLEKLKNPHQIPEEIINRLKKEDDLKAVIGATLNDENINRINGENYDEPNFNVFFDILNKDEYYEDKKLYTLHLDFNDKAHSTFHQELLYNKFSRIVFDFATINFLLILQNITYFLSFLKYDGELFLPIDYEKSPGMLRGSNDGKWLNYDGNELISKNELYGEYKLNYNEEKNIYDYTLIDKKKIENIINNHINAKIRHSIYYEGNKYYLNKEQEKELFIKKIKYIISGQTNNYEIIEKNKDYPFENKYIGSKDYIIIKKKNNFNKNLINLFININKNEIGFILNLYKLS